MNAFLLAAASLGALIVTATRTPDQLVLGNEAQHAADDAEVARLMAQAPDAGEMGEVVVEDAETGVKTKVSVVAFKD